MRSAAVAVRHVPQAAPEDPAHEDNTSGGSRLWLASATVMAGLHAGALAATILWQPSHEASIPPGAMAIELAPLAEPPAPVPPPPAPPQPPRPLEKIAPEPPQPPAVKKAELALPKPKPKVVPPPDATPAPAEKVSEDKFIPAPAITPAAHSINSPAPAHAPSLDAIPNWHGALRAHLERHKRYPAAAQFRRQQGVPMVRFVMDRDGKVLSAQLEHSCGHSSLDQEALALLERAQPLPTPPPEIPGERIEMRVPVQFFLR